MYRNSAEGHWDCSLDKKKRFALEHGAGCYWKIIARRRSPGEELGIWAARQATRSSALYHWLSKLTRIPSREIPNCSGKT